MTEENEEGIGGNMGEKDLSGEGEESAKSLRQENGGRRVFRETVIMPI